MHPVRSANTRTDGAPRAGSHLSVVQPVKVLVVHPIRAGYAALERELRAHFPIRKVDRAEEAWQALLVDIAIRAV